MELTNALTILASNFGASLPHFFVICIGIYVAFNLKSKYPKTFRAALIGLIILLIKTFLSIFSGLLFVYMPSLMRENMQMTGLVNLGISAVLNLLFAIGLGFIIYAITAERGK